MVDPLPDEPALERAARARMRRSSRRGCRCVAHRVRVLAHDHRPRVVARSRAHATISSSSRVHRADDVGGPVAAVPVARDRALVVQRPGRIAAPDPAGHRVVVAARSRSRCRATRAMMHGWFLSRSTIRDPAVEKGRCVARVAADLVVVRVRLDVRLVDHVEPVLVAEVVPVGVVRIVRGAHGVDVELLHQAHVAEHAARA